MDDRSDGGTGAADPGRQSGVPTGSAGHSFEHRTAVPFVTGETDIWLSVGGVVRLTEGSQANEPTLTAGVGGVVVPDLRAGLFESAEPVLAIEPAG